MYVYMYVYMYVCMYVCMYGMHMHHKSLLMYVCYAQDRVFDMIGKDAVINALQGYNSTIFAYGQVGSYPHLPTYLPIHTYPPMCMYLPTYLPTYRQTGSGKTFTITGGPER